jgi:antitoxin (DNA-binding transcriptional repressor) of toxin-antitoxin stability system
LDEVAEQNIELIVTKRGRAVARVVPIVQPREREAAALARLRGRARTPVGRDRDLLAPTSTLTRWKELSDKPK